MTRASTPSPSSFTGETVTRERKTTWISTRWRLAVPFLLLACAPVWLTSYLKHCEPGWVSGVSRQPCMSLQMFYPSPMLIAGPGRHSHCEERLCRQWAERAASFGGGWELLAPNPRSFQASPSPTSALHTPEFFLRPLKHFVAPVLALSPSIAGIG